MSSNEVQETYEYLKQAYKQEELERELAQAGSRLEAAQKEAQLVHLQKEVIMLESKIFSGNYYTACWIAAKKAYPGSITSKSLEELLHLLQLFWRKLPDSRAIRTNPFFLLCNLIETIEEEIQHEPESE